MKELIATLAITALLGVCMIALANGCVEQDVLNATAEARHLEAK